jgi:hypothetical protein
MIMKFCLIPHFFLGLYMYTNSSILTPSKIQSRIYNIISSRNQYFNSDRFANIHTAIFLSSIAFFVLLFIFRYTIFSLISKLGDLCKDLKKKLIPEEVASEDFYRDLSVMQLCKEFNKTTLERKEYDMIVRGGHHRQHFEKEMKLYLHKIDKKLTSMEDRFKEFFTRYNIPYGGKGEDKNGGKQRRRNLISAISDLLKLKDEIMRADHRLKSTIYSYDLADNDYYKGVMQVE